MIKKILIISLFAQALIFAQRSSGSVKLGYFNPNAVDGGFIIGYEGLTNYDANFKLGWSADWFHKSYTDQVLVNNYTSYLGIPTITNELLAKTNIHSIPVMATVTAEAFLLPRVKVFVTGGAGLESMLIFYSNFENTDKNDFKAAFDFAWRVGAGLLYELGRRSDLFAELTYHSSKPSWSYEIKDPNTGQNHQFERSFDMQGFMARVGFRFYY